MRRRLLSWVATACVFTVVVSGVALATGHGRIATEETLVVYSQTAKYHHVDVGKTGLSSGDQDIFFDTLFDDSAKTNKVGMDRVTCTYMPSKYLMCIDEFTITGRGKIVTSGSLHTERRLPRHGRFARGFGRNR